MLGHIKQLKLKIMSKFLSCIEPTARSIYEQMVIKVDYG